MRLSRDHIITHQPTRLGIPRAIRYTATHIPKCKLLPGKPKRFARQFAAHASATTFGGTPAATSATQETTEERDFRGIAAEEPEGEEEPQVHLPAEAHHRGSRRGGAMDTGVPATLVRSQRLKAGIHYLDAKPTEKQLASFLSWRNPNRRGIATTFERCRRNLPFAIWSGSRIIQARVVKQLKHGSTDIFIEQ